MPSRTPRPEQSLKDSVENDHEGFGLLTRDRGIELVVVS
jgi:hypothetical protein